MAACPGGVSVIVLTRTAGATAYQSVSIESLSGSLTSPRDMWTRGIYDDAE